MKIEHLTSAHISLNSSKELRKRDKMRGFPCIQSLFGDKFNQFNNIVVCLFDFKITLRSHFCREHVKILSICAQQWEHIGSVIECLTRDQMCLQVQASPGSLYCVLEQDTLILA